MILEHSKEEFYKFVKILNTHHPSITVKAELSSESMHSRHSSLQRKQGDRDI